MKGDWLVILINDETDTIHSLRCNTKDAADKLIQWVEDAGDKLQSFAAFKCYDPQDVKMMR